MKKLLLILLLVFSGREAFTQIIFSNGTGGGSWSNTSTWLGGIIPGINNDVIIAGTDSVTTEASAVCNNLTILSGGKFVTSIDTVGVNGILTLEAEAWYFNRANDPTLPGIEVILDPESYVVHSGSGTIGGEGNSEFGNLIIQRSVGVVPGADLIIYGDLIIDNSAANVVLRGVRPATGSQTHTVCGDLVIKKGTLSCVDDVNPEWVGIWNIKGNVYVTDNEEPYLESRIGCFSSANAAGLGIINIDGDLIIEGGRLQAGTSSSAGIGRAFINLAGDLIMDSNSRVATNHAGPFTLNFTGTEPQLVKLDMNFNMSTVLNDTVKPGSSVVFEFDTTKWQSSAGGDFVVEGALELIGNSRISGAGNFYVNPNAHLSVGSPFGLNADSSGNIRVSGTRSYSSGASYEFNSSVAQQTGSALPAEVSSVTINNDEYVTLSSDLKILNDLHILQGDLDLNGKSITLAENAVLSESSGNTVTGSSGKISIIMQAGSPSFLNPGGLGAVISSDTDLKETSIERSHFPYTAFNNKSILRSYKITPGQNSNLNAGLRFYYDESELNGLPEENLVLVKSADGTEGSWIYVGGTVNTGLNFVEASGINDFSYWTLTDKNNSITNIDAGRYDIPRQLSYNLEQNYPNPFNPSTRINFSTQNAGHTELSVYNMLGEKILTILNKELPAGNHEIVFDAYNLASGIYFYKIVSGSWHDIRKMVLTK